MSEGVRESGKDGFGEFDLLRREWIGRLGRFRSGHRRLQLQLGRGRRHRRASGARGLTGGSVDGDIGGLNSGTAPRTVIDDQQGNHADEGNHQRDHDRNAPGMPFDV